MKTVLVLTVAFLLFCSNATFACGFNCKNALDAQSSYYLTPQYYPADEVLDSCVAGYHFASIWELTSYTMMTYNRELGFPYTGTSPFPWDIEYGPPSRIYGWVRSGDLSSNDNNCMGWQSDAYDMEGISAIFWVTDDQHILKVDHQMCDELYRVWCVSNPVDSE